MACKLRFAVPLLLAIIPIFPWQIPFLFSITAFIINHRFLTNLPLRGKSRQYSSSEHNSVMPMISLQ